MFVIVTGDIGVGKSTVCRKLVQAVRDNGLVCGGILTFKSANGGITVEDVQSDEQTSLAEINHGASDGPRTVRYLFNHHGIDLGIQALHRAVAADVLLIDEIGQLDF